MMHLGKCTLDSAIRDGQFNSKIMKTVHQLLLEGIQVEFKEKLKTKSPLNSTQTIYLWRRFIIIISLCYISYIAMYLVVRSTEVSPVMNQPLVNVNNI